ncbi:MAG TPA: LacI family DNA-binding transcriptional regulator [Terriglobia bacterium]|nr:LacI family DNA-binding transcriptional regulator [Terriglobia bacterium]
MATINEIARQLGVSISTVSAVVNRRGYVSPAMRARVERALEEAQYRPNDMARGLRLGQSRTIGLIVPDLTNSFFARLMRGAEDYLASLDYRLLMADSREEWQRQREYLISFAGRKTDGILLVPCRSTDEQIATIPGLIGNTPLVYVDRSPMNPTGDSVLADNVRAGYAATSHLLELGHRRIAILSEPLDLLNGADRLEGYKKALRARRVALDRNLICFGGDTEDSGYWCGLDLFKRGVPPTAVVVCNNLMTLGLLTALRDARLECPRDVSIIGFDDFEWCPHLSPPLSMVRVPAAELGSAAAKALMRRLRGADGRPPESTLLPAQLVLRKSTGSPRQPG